MFLTFLTFLPLIGALLLAFIPREEEGAIKQTALAIAAADFLFSILLWTNFDSTTHEMQFEYSVPWITTWGVSYHVGIDGISLLLYIMTTFLTMISIIASWDIQKYVREYMMAFLALSTGMLGVFISLDMFLFYFFWEFQLVPMYIIIGIWGGPRRVYAAIKFFLYTAFGSLLMLVAIIWIYTAIKEQTGVATTDLVFITENLDLPLTPQKWLFMAFFLAFAIKVPMFPFHTWLPDAHVEAPTAGSVILAGVLLKMGTYGFFRFNLPLFPHASYDFMPMIAYLSIIGIIYGALVSLVQEDLKKLVAYSSVSHLGFVMIGIFALNHYGMQGALLQNINHGISTGALFLLVGVLYDRAHHRWIVYPNDHPDTELAGKPGFGGLASRVPRFSALVALAFFAGLGLPALSGFISEAMCFIGGFSAFRTLTVIGAFGILLNAIYFLRAYQRMFMGDLNDRYSELPEINNRELFTVVPLAIITLFLGIYPSPLIDIISPALTKLLALF